MSLRGCLLLVFIFISDQIVTPISSLFDPVFFEATVVFHTALVMITTAVLTKVFLIVFANKENKKDRFLFLSLTMWSCIFLILGFIMGIVWLLD